MGKIKELWHNEQIREFVRFVIVGGFATVVDFLVMSLILYCFEPSIYPTFWSIFLGGTKEPTTVATVVGTGCGFVISLIFNYLLSVFFVYKQQGNSKTLKGIILFVVLAVGGLLIHLVGMYIGFDLLGINEWLVKIFFTAVVLVYNFITRKYLIFNEKKANKVDANQEQPQQDIENK